MDLQIISYRDLAGVSNVGVAGGSAGTVLTLQGRDFVNVTDVLINGVPSPQYVVISTNQISAQIPESQLSRFIASVSVLTASVGQTGASVVSFRQTGGRGEAVGITYLVQSFLTVLLASPGSDIFNPELGGGLRRLISGAVASSSFRAEVSQAVTRTTTQILSLQAPNALPAEDKLASAQLLEASYDRRTASVSIRVQIFSTAGRAADAGIRLATEASA